MLDWLDILARIGVAALIGAAIGLNRNLHHEYVGLRTLALVGASSGALMLATLVAADGSVNTDALSRVIQGILTGLGFIGAGVIVRGKGETRVLGLTTAASVWTTAILGMLAGIGAWRVALVLGLVSGMVLLLGGPVERLFRKAMHDDEPDGADRP